MKKNYTKTAILALAMAFGLNAHAQFIEQTSYVGAFGTTDWTATWANFDPSNKVYSATNATLSGTISANTTLDASKTYLITGLVYVKNGATLTIPAGTVLRGDKATQASLIVERGGKLIAEGTVSQPIVFTSNQPAGQREPGDWGGIILLGKAPSNQPGDASKGLAVGEGIIEGPDFSTAADKGTYGGTDVNDNSGSLKYVRIEFGGIAYQPNVEINGLTLGSVGAGTSINFVQVSYCGDDSYEWFGGTVNCKHLIAHISTDDDFDTDNGYSGKVQFAVSLRHPDYYDPTYANTSGASTSEGFESDNDASGSSRTPLTAAVFSNVTICGPIRNDQVYADLSSTVQAAFRRGARIRRASSLSVMNSIIMGYRSGLYLDAGTSATTSAPPHATVYKALNSDSLQFRNNIIAGCKDSVEINSAGYPVTKTAVRNWVMNTLNANRYYMSNGKAAGLLTNPYNYTAPNFLPVSGSLALSGADFTSAKFGTLAGINDNAKTVASLNVYPNPTNGIANVTLNLNATAQVKVAIIDVTGKVVKTLATQSLVPGINTIQVSTEELTEGMYFVQATTANGTTTAKLSVVK